jgi:hypothetical protein
MKKSLKRAILVCLCGPVLGACTSANPSSLAFRGELHMERPAPNVPPDSVALANN